jgi:alcohol dehydrogenase (cytochrome c)
LVHHGERARPRTTSVGGGRSAVVRRGCTQPVQRGCQISRSDGYWAGWVYAVDADTGVWKWRLKSNYPIVSGMTPTAGGVVFFGDVGGNFYVLDAANGQKLWGHQLGGALGGGVITYTVNGAQKVAVAAGFTSPIWPVKIVRPKIEVLGLDSASASR